EITRSLESTRVLFRSWSSQPLDSTQKCFCAEATTEGVGHSGSGKITEPPQQENREWRPARPVSKKASEGDDCVGWKRREKILERRERGYGDVERSERQVPQPFGD